jgi:hypothetical protein
MVEVDEVDTVSTSQMNFMPMVLKDFRPKLPGDTSARIRRRFPPELCHRIMPVPCHSRAG